VAPSGRGPAEAAVSVVAGARDLASPIALPDPGLHLPDQERRLQGVQAVTPFADPGRARGAATQPVAMHLIADLTPAEEAGIEVHLERHVGQAGRTRVAVSVDSRVVPGQDDDVIPID